MRTQKQIELEEREEWARYLTAGPVVIRDRTQSGSKPVVWPTALMLALYFQERGLVVVRHE